MAPAHWGLGEKDRLLAPPCKASKLLTDHLITCKPLKSEPDQEKRFSLNIHTYKQCWFAWCLSGYIYDAHFECHDILMLRKSPIKWRQRPDMTIAVDLDLKHHLKQTNSLLVLETEHFQQNLFDICLIQYTLEIDWRRWF